MSTPSTYPEPHNPPLASEGILVALEGILADDKAQPIQSETRSLVMIALRSAGDKLMYIPVVAFVVAMLVLCSANVVYEWICKKVLSEKDQKD